MKKLIPLKERKFWDEINKYYPSRQCIGRLCRIVNGRLVTITYLFL